MWLLLVVQKLCRANTLRASIVLKIMFFFQINCAKNNVLLQKDVEQSSTVKMHIARLGK